MSISIYYVMKMTRDITFNVSELIDTNYVKYHGKTEGAIVGADIRFSVTITIDDDFNIVASNVNACKTVKYSPEMRYKHVQIPSDDVYAVKSNETRYVWEDSPEFDTVDPTLIVYQGKMQRREDGLMYRPACEIG